MSEWRIIEILLKKHFASYSLAAMPGGATGARLYRITTDNDDAFVLKTQLIHSASESLEQEKKVYDSLLGKVPVPAVRFYEIVRDTEFLCMSLLHGRSLNELIGEWSNKGIVALYGQSLRRLHHVPLNDKTPVQSIEKRLGEARQRMERGLVDVHDFDPINRGKSPKELYQQLLLIQPAETELVFTHGDYCFDNVIGANGDLSGFVDMGRGGIADRYQDIALAVRSIVHELGHEWLPDFYLAYGLTQPDEQKIEFYQLLDEFF
jgi:aminoglycoside phosphotransferase